MKICVKTLNAKSVIFGACQIANVCRFTYNFHILTDTPTLTNTSMLIVQATFQLNCLSNTNYTMVT